MLVLPVDRSTVRSARVLRLLEQSATEQLRRRARCGRSSEQGWRGTREKGQVVRQRKAWPTWSFVTRAYAGAIDRDLSLDTTNAEISADVSNVPLGGVQLNDNVLSCVFPVERCKTWCIDARSVGNFAGDERCGRSIWMLDASR